MGKTCRESVIEALDRLERQQRRDVFDLWEIVDEVRRHTRRFKESTIRTHVSSYMCAQAPKNHGTKFSDLDRVSRGQYRRRN